MSVGRWSSGVSGNQGGCGLLAPIAVVVGVKAIRIRTGHTDKSRVGRTIA